MFFPGLVCEINGLRLENLTNKKFTVFSRSMSISAYYRTFLGREARIFNEKIALIKISSFYYTYVTNREKRNNFFRVIHTFNAYIPFWLWFCVKFDVKVLFCFLFFPVWFLHLLFFQKSQLITVLFFILKHHQCKYDYLILEGRAKTMARRYSNNLT